MSNTSFNEAEVEAMSPSHFRHIVRQGSWTGRTDRPCRNYARANLAVVPRAVAFEFFLFCHRNRQPLPVMDVTDPGTPRPALVAPSADLRTDLPRYSVFKNGELIDEPTHIRDYWRDDLVCFLLGCSVSFDWQLQAANVNYRLFGAYFNTSINCIPTGPFKGPMAVTCRLFKSTHDAVRAIQISSRLPVAHGAPVHIGDPAAIGIKDFSHPDVGPLVSEAAKEPSEIALYWGCGMTVQTVARESKLPLMITHCPAHMFVIDLLTEELAVI